MKKPSIPSVQPVQDRVIAGLLAPIKESVEIITGARGKEISKLGSDATLTEVINKVNEIISRLNASGD